MIKDISQVDEELEKFRIKVEATTEEILKDILSEGAKSIALNSPVVTGHYINNHEITLGSIGKGGKPAVKKTKKIVSPGGAKTRMLSKFISIIEGITRKNKIISISNAVPYAINVEVLGWGKKPAYAVYQKAMSALQAEAVKQKAGFNAKEY